MDLAPIFVIAALGLLVAIVLESNNPKNYPPGV